MILVESCWFVFKKKTAYEMRISDWSSDVCSSDLVAYRQPRLAAGGENPVTLPGDASIHRQTPSPLMTMGLWHHGKAVTVQSSVRMAIGRASCQDRWGQHV